MNPHQMTRDFERAVCEYTGAPYCVAVNSCSMALLLAVAWYVRTLKDVPHGRYYERHVEIPKRTYVGVPQSIIRAGGCPTFRDEDWRGYYQLKPLPVWDSARYFSGDMYTQVAWVDVGVGDMVHGGMVCVSFHWTKTLGVEFEQGGAILLDDAKADAWLRRARFDGRTEGVAPKDDHFDMVGWHAYMNPSTAERLLKALQFLPKHNDPLPNDDYPDLSLHEAFR